LNVVFVAAEAGFGIAAGSLALIADAGHNLSDVLSLLLAWGAGVLATRGATEKRTYGFRKLTILASLANAIMLFIALGGIAWEAVGRLFNPGPVEAGTVVAVAAVGVVVNTVTALMFLPGRKKDMNIKGVFLHMAVDAAVSLGVVVSGILIGITGWLWIDPAISLAIALVILIGTGSFLRDSMNLAIDSVPRAVDMAGIKAYLTGLENVCGMHDLHVWALSTTEIALSVHLVVRNEIPDQKFLADLQRHLRDRFHIGHATIQIERPDDESCLLDQDECI
ncbi:cation transporter, partial [bacterium]|nr:cation transporter [bacterium]